MICRDKIIFSCLIACGLGAAGGYLFSSKFCKVTIVKRVAKEVALNQTLRQLFAEQAFWIHNHIRATFFNSPDEQAIAKRILKNQEEIANIFKAYYGQSSADEIKKLISENTKLISQIILSTKENKPLTDISNEWKKNSDAISLLLSQLNPAWKQNIIKAGLDGQLSLITQEIEALQKNNWPRAIEIFDKHLDFALQLADEIDNGITRQFPNKF